MPLDFVWFGESQCILKLSAEVSDSASHRVRAVGAGLPAKGIATRP